MSTNKTWTNGGLSITEGSQNGAKIYGSLIPNIIREQMRNSKGGVIGLNGKGAIALRVDDSVRRLKTNNLLNEFSSRRLPFGLALVPDFNIYFNLGASFIDIGTWNQTYGMEVWAHGVTDHRSPQSPEQLKKELLDCKASIESNNLKCQGFMQPGTPAPLGYYANTAILSDFYSEHGRLLYENFALFEASLGGVHRFLNGQPYFGGGHYTISTLQGVSSSAQLTNMKALVDWAAKFKRGIEFMAHLEDIDLTNTLGSTKFTLADLQGLLDYIASTRDSGKIEVLTPSGLHYADAISTSRLDLVGDGKFTGLDPATNRGSWSYTTNWTGKTFPQTGGYSGGAYLSIDNTTDSIGSFVSQKIDYLNLMEVQGETFQFIGYARSNGAGNQRIRCTIQSDTASPVTLVNVASGGHYDITVPTTWTKVTFPFSLPKDKTNMLLILGRATAGAALEYGVDWSDVSIVKI